MYKKDIQKIRQIIQDIEPKCDYYGNAWLTPESIEKAVREIIFYLSDKQVDWIKVAMQ
jgi:hypothetical protein